jgi:hypothetical protein
MCPCVLFCDEWLSTWSTKKVEWWLTLSWWKLCVRHVSWLVLCRCRARRRWSTAGWMSSRDVPCRWTGSGEGRMWGLDRGTRRPGDQPRWLTSETSTSASVHVSDRVDRVKTEDVQVERGSEDLACRPVKDGGDTCRAVGFWEGMDGTWRRRGVRV